GHVRDEVLKFDVLVRARARLHLHGADGFLDGRRDAADRGVAPDDLRLAIRRAPFDHAQPVERQAFVRHHADVLNQRTVRAFGQLDDGLVAGRAADDRQAAAEFAAFILAGVALVGVEPDVAGGPKAEDVAGLTADRPARNDDDALGEAGAGLVRDAVRALLLAV